MESLLLRETWGERFKSIIGQSVHVTRPACALLRREHTREMLCMEGRVSAPSKPHGESQVWPWKSGWDFGDAKLGRIHQHAFKGDKRLSLFWRLLT